MKEQITFDGKGPLAAAIRLSGGKPSARTSQSEFAACLTSSMEARQPAFIDAETGVGKTLAYLLPNLEKMVHHKQGGESKPILVVSTATVNLQQQVLLSDIPIAVETIKQAFNVEMTAALRVGRSQVIDPDRLSDAIYEQPESNDELQQDILDWCNKEVANDCLPLRSDLLVAFAERLTYLPAWLAPDLVGLDPRPGTTPSRVSELYQGQLQSCEEADILVVNHHLLALHLRRPFLWPAEREAYIVVDEADRLPDICDEINQSVVPFMRLNRCLDALGQGGIPAKQGVERAIEASQNLFELAWQGNGGGVVSISQLDRADKREFLSVLTDTATSLETSIAIFRGREIATDYSLRDVWSDLQRYSIDIRNAVDKINAEQSGRTVIYYSPVRAYPGIASIGDGMSNLIAKRLWREPNSPILSLTFTSATLSTLAQAHDINPKRGLAAFYKRCGFTAEEIPLESCAVISPARFGSMSFVRPPLDCPAPFSMAMDGLDKPAVSQEAVEFWCQMIRSAHRRGGRVLVLVPSYHDLEAITEKLSGEYPDQFVAQTRGLSTQSCTTRFLAQNSMIWVSAIAWEGLSLPGCISHIVMPRLPIRPLSYRDTILQQYINEQSGSDSAGRSVVFGRQMAEARRKVRQGIGRGIRTHTDEVTVWIGDPRWPVTQREIDELFLDQPRPWSSTMVNAVSKRFRKNLEKSERFVSEGV